MSNQIVFCGIQKQKCIMPVININEPRWDQNTYWGRAKHFFTTTNPCNLLYSSSELDKAKEIVTKYRTVPQVVFWQWINQSFNAVVNYTNRSGDSPIPVKQLGTSYVLATSGALITALGLNSIVKSAPPLIGRFVPFCAVAAANCVNIPMMRLKEIREGIPVVDKNGNRVGNSQVAAKSAITQVTMSRIGMAMPGMLIPPFIMNYLDRKGVIRKFPWINAPLQVGLCGLFLVFATPLCCALFPQQSSINVDSLEPEIRESLNKLKLEDKCLYYNKGL
ncbi:sideroflexin-1 isoform X4 [Parasteatoda tepidariorum]|uniref:sideroflexin-1 isoform X4 n=2 Tax=Parasteatoda tepidariorum TaxID=114398 RepID=UPI001C72289C|nr:sideroflexin-3 isoform X4 [Parasteatoda tepidariorum]